MRLLPPILLLSLALLVAAPAVAQDPWEGWVGPPADGVLGLRFGMDRETVDAGLAALGLQQAHGRDGTMRHFGKLDDRAIEVLTLFDADARGDRLYRIQLRWEDLLGTPDRSMRFFEEWEAKLESRYGPALMRREIGVHALSTAQGTGLRLYQGPEMQAILELRPPKPGRIDLTLILDYPPLHPGLPGS